jgi:uncharacterized protein (TIGR03067 family)
MKNTITALTLATLLGAGAAAPADERPEGKPKASPLAGEYTITGGEKHGNEIPADRLEDNVVRISDRTFVVFDREKNQTYADSYRLDTTKKPWRIRMTSTRAPAKGVKAEGLVQVDGDRVKLIYALTEGKPPTEFRTQDRQVLFLLKKVDKPAK